MISAPSPNFDDRPAGAPIDHLVLHYTGMQTAQAAIDRLRDPAAKVSAHYVVDEDGTVYALVDEQKRAWHAGVSYWRGVRQLNDRSIGIEIVNPGHEWGYRAFPKVQMLAVRDLCLGILHRHPIPPRNVVGHSDIAPDRKQDPGELFDWQWLAGQGVGFWTDAVGEPGDLMQDLAAIGYDTSLPEAAVITAFQRRFLPERLTSVADEATLKRAAGVL
ncbi:MAG: N-acetylmuramoyl-L-alanine amidase [Acidocella sp. 20-57-95]|nr:MAG: N-acetylmuramoyl-L-alanine amidase [Acidocella sp. 20-57-95]OYV59689.1 MAG: N-acetylmuramoyl-L-alanine amidase [Acidocella sp. 21-58-7]HQT63351.1 N-acetylmuramoyl-L-alanine amidase [Acidocella sp.]HQU04843.1 N-acetylmuramoyl-L-alanine amidase [Acidocella sp.]